MELVSKIILTIFLLVQSLSFVQADGEIDLVRYMSSLQYFSHKTNLAIEKQNKPLASFYAHELEETIEHVEKVKSYDGYPIGNLVKSMLGPAFEDFEKALKSENWNHISSKFDALIQSCNSCHKATSHSFIKIERRLTNPFMQSFETFADDQKK